VCGPFQLLHPITRNEEDRTHLVFLSDRERKAGIMSQQEMNYEEVKRTPPGTGYTSMSYDYSTGSQGQKISDHASFKAPSTGQRLALAIVSLAMLMVMTLALIAIGVATNVNGAGAAGLVFVIVLFYVAVIIINVLFNRKY
jgi:hypothetical protein